MTERLALIHELLQETREAQVKGNAMLTELRVEVAALQRAHDGQGQSIADLRAEMRQLSDRLRDSEMQMQRLPQAIADIAKLEERIDGYHSTADRRHTSLEGRVRSLENDGREHKVVTGAFVGGIRDLWRYAAAAIVGAVIMAMAWAGKLGGPPV